MRYLLFVLSWTILLAGCTLSAESPTPTPLPPTPDIPSVTFLYPQDDTPVVEGSELRIDIVAQDSVGIQKIEVRLNGQLLIPPTWPETGPAPVYRLETNWIATGIGRHVLSAIAYRSDGTRSDETIIEIEVIAP